MLQQTLFFKQIGSDPQRIIYIVIKTFYVPIKLKSIQIENSIEYQTALKCFFDTTKWMIKPTKSKTSVSDSKSM